VYIILDIYIYLFKSIVHDRSLNQLYTLTFKKSLNLVFNIKNKNKNNYFEQTHIMLDIKFCIGMRSLAFQASIGLKACNPLVVAGSCLYTLLQCVN